MKLMGKLLSFFLLIGFGILSGVFCGYTLSTLYGWFVLPHFSSLPKLGTLAFIGIRIFVGSLTFDGRIFADAVEKKFSEDSSVNTVYKIGALTAGYALVLGVGWLWHLVIIHNG
jgi:hypothetical protein